MVHLALPKKKLLQSAQLLFGLLLVLYLLRAFGRPEGQPRVFHTVQTEMSLLEREIDQVQQLARMDKDNSKDNYDGDKDNYGDKDKEEEQKADVDLKKEEDGWNFDTSNKRDWHNWTQIQEESLRDGPGEHGTKVKTKPTEKKLRDALYQLNGFNAFISDKIAVDRAVPDIRHKGCQSQQYSSELPTVSVVVPFLNEHWTTLLRTFHSVLNRSPRHLLKEIILVDDASTKESCHAQLDAYLANAGGDVTAKVRLIRLPERGGLIAARQTGAKAARGQVLIFLDSHTEANVNWLPPLLEPIASDFRTAVCPFIDVIDMENFAYRAQDEGKRGGFDWELYYKRLDLLPDDLANPTRPFKSPVMAGGLFAISAKFFWELGGYDEGLKIWGGEQYELSFKIWQCGGQMFDAPCSRVGHIYRQFAPFNGGGFGNYLGKNYRRVAEVWMDEYKEFIYKRRPNYRNIDPGDISEQLALRKRLKCKSFKWFMEEVAFDLPKKYPMIEPEPFGHGKIRNDKHKDFCVHSNGMGKPYSVQQCGHSPLHQDFELTWHKDVRLKGQSKCWDVFRGGPRPPVEPYVCHLGGGNQLWKYDLTDHKMRHGGGNSCLDMDAEAKQLFLTECDSSSDSQKWTLEHVNEEGLKKWSKA